MRFGSLFSLAAFATGAAAQVSSGSNAIYKLSNNSEFAFIFEEILALSNDFGANTGEVLRAASQIIPGNFESWYTEFNFLANAIHNKAHKINSSRFPISAREAYFRSATYYRAADFFLHGNLSDPRIYTLWDKALADFDKAANLLPYPVEKKNLTAGNFSIPILFYPAQSPKFSGRKKSKQQRLPTVIVGSGYDGSQEALYHTIGRSLLDRGYNVVTYEGPGQPTVRRQQQIGFIPNWWDVLTPVVDYLETRDDVEKDKLALYGLSFGGLLAPRAASREHRLQAVLAIDGILDMQAAVLDPLPKELTQLFKSGNHTAFDEVMLGLARNTSTPTQLRWLIDQSLFAFDTASPYDWMTRLGEFTIDKAMLNNITAKVFIGAGQDDSTAPSQPGQMAEWLGKKATYNLWLSELGAGEHCQLGAERQLAQVTVDWLADVFEGIAVPRNLTESVD